MSFVRYGLLSAKLISINGKWDRAASDLPFGYGNSPCMILSTTETTFLMFQA
jgi:hypothetical protein